MRLNNKLILWFLIIFILLLSSCSYTDTSIPEEVNLNQDPYSDYDFDKDKTIRIGEQPLWIPASTITGVMKRDEILKEQLNNLGYNLEFYSFLKGNDVNDFLFKGDLDIGISGDMPAIKAVSNGNFVALSLVQSGYVSLISRDINKIDDLKGKKIAYAYGSNAHYYLLRILSLSGIKLSDVNLIPMNVNKMTNALAKGQIDVFSAWEPTPSITLREYPNFIKMHDGESLGFIYAKKELYEDEPELINYLVASEIRALRWLRNSPDNIEIASGWVVDAITKFEPDYSISSAMVAQLTREDLPGRFFVEYPSITEDTLAGHNSIEKQFEFMKSNSFIDKEVEWNDVKGNFILEIIPNILENPDKYRIFDEKIMIGEK